jgi:hypothetical protein
MLKNLRRNDLQTTPFVATKSWVLTNFPNQSVDQFILEGTGTEISFALEFIDYEGGTDLPIINRECNITLEQQINDNIIYEDGEKIEGTFYPDSDPVNKTGTYKRLVHNQIKNAFYNDWNDPTKMFGMENIDFQLSETKKFLSDNFRLFNISKNYFGEKMLENSIVLVDNSLDDSFEIVDDGNGNIIAKENLFSKIQEVRKLNNLVDPLGTSNSCDNIYVDIESRQAGNGAPYGTAGTAGYYPPSNCQPW